MCRIVYCLLLLSILCYQSEAARILGAVFTPSYSHQLAFQPIWKELSKRGHQVTVLTTDPINDPSLVNLTEIDLHFSYDVMKEFKTDELLTRKNESVVSRFKRYMAALHAVADKQLADPPVQNLINNKSEIFDLLIVEVTYPTQLAFAWRFQVPFIGLMSYEAPSRIHSAIGNPIHPALYPDVLLPFDKNLTFVERLISSVVLWVSLLYGHYILYPREDSTVKKYFGDDAPSLYEIQKNMSMLFVNTHPVLNVVRPLVPSTIQIGGGIHFQAAKPLSQDLQEYLDGAKEGFIYFSLGTNVKSSALEQHIKDAILESFSELPFKVLWKFEDEHIPNKPDNVKIVPWISSQIAILAHPNIKLFITQCGLQSMEEAIFNQVPMVGIPFYGDQLNNARLLESKGIGIRLSVSELDKQKLKDAIINVTSTSCFKKNVDELAFLYKDQEVSGLEKAIWWSEYIIRHKGAPHLRCPVVDLPLYQYFCLDVISFIIGIFILVIISIKVVIKLVKLILRRGSKEKVD